MSRGKGMQAAGWVAGWLSTWWPDAEALPAGLPGADIENTPGVAFEVKTGASWRNDWVRQAAGYGADGNLPVLVYLPPGMGANRIRHAQAVMPLHWLMYLLQESGYAPRPAGAVTEQAPIPHILRQVRAQVGNALPAATDPQCRNCRRPWSGHPYTNCPGFEGPEWLYAPITPEKEGSENASD